MSRNTGKLYPFPSDLIDPKEKLSEEKFGIPLAKAIYYNNRKIGSSIFSNDKRIHRYYIDYALGRQDESKYKPLLGINSNNITNSMLPAIRWNIRNYATKRVNSVVSVISNKKYDPIVEAIDPFAVDIKEEYKSRIKAFVKEKDWVQDLAKLVGVDLTPYGINPEEIPMNDEELDIHMETNFKLRSEMELEDGIAYHLERNGYEQQRKQILFDLFVVGVGCLWTGVDEYGVPVIERVSPDDMIVPYSEKPDFSNINYAGRIKRMTVAELKKLAGDTFTKDQYIDIEENFTNTTDREHDFDDVTHGGYSSSDSSDVQKIKVMYYEYLSQDEMVHIEKKDSYGNNRFVKQPYNVYKTKPEQEKFKAKYGNSRKLYRNQYWSVYCGYWIVGSDYIFNYGIRHNTERTVGNLGDARLGFKLYSPNLYSGEVISTIKQMIPILDSLQDYHLKIQHIVASAIPKGLEIDIFQLSKVKFKGKGGRDMTDMEKLEMYFQRGILLKNSEGNYSQGSGHQPIRELENGMAQDIVHYLNLIASAKEELDEITGVNRVMTGGNLHADTGKGVAEIQQQGSITALDYLFDADEYLFVETCKSLGILHCQSVKYGTNERRYKNIIGAGSASFVKDKGITEHDYGFYVEPRPSTDEWQRFYMSVDLALRQKEITLADATFLYRIKSLKKAEQYLSVAAKRQLKIASQKAQQDMQMNQQMQMQSNDQAHQNAMMLEQTRQQTILLQAEEERKTLQLKMQLEAEMQIKLEQMRSGAKVQMNERLASSKEEVEVFKRATEPKRQ